jgi:two-component system KDP operon response regulator KdpE
MMDAPARILIIEDEPAIRNLLRMSLTAQNYKIAEAADGSEGLAKAVEFHPHLILLDLGLPDIQGHEIVTKLRAWTSVPIIVLTVLDEESSKVQLLDAGADDYLTKPFGQSELLARVRVCLRTHRWIEATPVFVSEDLKVDLNQKTVSLSGAPLKMTLTEYRVIACLVRDQGRVVSPTRILKEVWGANATEHGHYLRIYINQLRKKIEKNPAKPQHILTEPGLGYRLV